MLSQDQQSRRQTWARIHGFFLAFALVLLATNLTQVEAAGDVAAPIWISTNAQTDWDGNDGPWSTFSLQIGEQNQSTQVVRVIPAFHHGHLLVVARDGCPDGKLPKNCSQHRGGVFDYKTAVWWDSNTKMLGNVTSPFPPDNSRGRMNTTVYITGELPIKLRSQNVLLTQNMSPFIGEVGLSQDDDTLMQGQLSFLRSASSKGPKSFSYTAGVAATKSPGSLLLGGYDASRISPNTSLGFSTMKSSANTYRLNIHLDYIKTVYQQSLLDSMYINSSIPFVIDPVTPYMWLPVEIMTSLEKAMGLQYDPASELYLLPSTQARIPDLYFGVTSGWAFSSTAGVYQPPGSLPSDNITSMRYHSSDLRLLVNAHTLALNASYPLYNGSSNDTNPRQYAPFKKGPYPPYGEYTLGRAFFQSIHIIANYERNGFSLSQAKYDPADSRAPTGLSPDSLGPVTDVSPSAPTSYPYSDPAGGASLAVILIAVLSTVSVLGLSISIYGCCAYRKAKWPFKRRRNQDEDGDVLRTAKAELDGTTSSASNDKGLSLSSTEISEVSEMQGSDIPVEMRGSPIVKAELDGDMPSYELDARPKSIDWGNKDADPSIIVRRLLAR